MGMRAIASFAMKSWDEKPYDEFEGGRKLTRADVVYTYQGDIEGEGKVQYLMAYAPNGTGNFVGIERVVGKFAGRSGSFVMQHDGTFEAHGVTDRWTIVPGTGTGELQSLTGKGEGTISGHGPYPITFEYELK